MQKIIAVIFAVGVVAGELICNFLEKLLNEYCQYYLRLT